MGCKMALKDDLIIYLLLFGIIYTLFILLTGNSEGVNIVVNDMTINPKHDICIFNENMILQSCNNTLIYIPANITNTTFLINTNILDAGQTPSLYNQFFSYLIPFIIIFIFGCMFVFGIIIGIYFYIKR
jgi:hypothetical protein